MGEKEELAELDEKIPPLSRPENIRRIVYLFIGFAAVAIISVIPTPMGPLAQRALGVLAFVVVLWVTEAFPLGMTALFGITLLPILGVLPLEDAFYGFKSTALFFLIGALSFGIAMQKTNLHKRFALKILNRFGKSSSSIIFSVCLLGCYMSMTMPCHAVAALLLPVLVGIIEAGDISPGENFGIAIFLALTYGTSVGSIGTLLGGARNVLTIGIVESLTQSMSGVSPVSISFLDWAIAGVPIASALMVVTYYVLRFVYPWKEVDTDRIRTELSEEVEEMGDISRGEKKAGIVFFVTFVLWVTMGQDIGLSIVAIGGFFALVVTRTINWRDIKENMPWGLIFLYGGALTLSHALTQTEAVKFIGDRLVTFVGQNLLVILIVFLILVVVISNLMSNSAATAVVLPIALTSVIGLGLAGPRSAELVAYLIAMGSAMVFLLPIGTPSAAIVYSSGYVEVKDLVKAGAVLTVLSIIVFLLVGLGWWKILGIW